MLRTDAADTMRLCLATKRAAARAACLMVGIGWAVLRSSLAGSWVFEAATRFGARLSHRPSPVKPRNDGSFSTKSCDLAFLYLHFGNGQTKNRMLKVRSLQGLAGRIFSRRACCPFLDFFLGLFTRASEGMRRQDKLGAKSVRYW